MDFIKSHKKIVIIAGTSVAVIALAIIAILLIGGKADDNKDAPVVISASSADISSDTSSIIIPEIVVKDKSEPTSSETAASSEPPKKVEEKKTQITAGGDTSSKIAPKKAPVVSQVEKKTVSKPVVDPPKPPAPTCNCTEKCDQTHFSTTCTICKEPAADFSKCKGNPPQCICRAKCTDTTNDRCRICMHSYDLGYDCLGTELVEPPYNPTGPQHGDKEVDPDSQSKYRYYHVGMNMWIFECQFICQRLGEHPEETDYNNYAQYMEHGNRCVAHKIGVDGKPFDSIWCQYCKMFIQEKFVQLHNDEKI